MFDDGGDNLSQTKSARSGYLGGPKAENQSFNSMTGTELSSDKSEGNKSERNIKKFLDKNKNKAKKEKEKVK